MHYFVISTPNLVVLSLITLSLNACATERGLQPQSEPLVKEHAVVDSTIIDSTLIDSTLVNGDKIASPPKYRITLAPYSTFLNKEGFLDFTKVSLMKIQTVLGEAPVSLRIGRPGASDIREVRVYFPYEEDPTGLFLFFRNETVVSFRMDEFSGISSPLIQDFFNQDFFNK